MIISTQTIVLALSLGMLPAILWLIFWLREDKKHPEPIHVIIVCFLFGGLAVFGSIALEKLSIPYVISSPVLMIVAWSAIEETLKYIAAKIGGLQKQWYNEPIDALIYLLATALGFAAFENTLYLMSSLGVTDFTQTLVLSNFRFIGASMLHFVSSVTLGAFIAFSFYKTARVRRIYTLLGLSTAITLHAVFNLLIIKEVLTHTVLAFVVVWISIIILIGIFERIKKISPLTEEIT